MILKIYCINSGHHIEVMIPNDTQSIHIQTDTRKLGNIDFIEVDAIETVMTPIKRQVTKTVYS